jgi:hypothetical protein
MDNRQLAICNWQFLPIIRRWGICLLPITSRRRFAYCLPQANLPIARRRRICLLWRLPNILEEAENEFRLEDWNGFIY